MPPISKVIYRLIGKTLNKYNMIQEGDRIIVALSGGKDSLTLLYDLSDRRRTYPAKFQLEAVHIESEFCSCDLDALKRITSELNVPFHVIYKNMAETLLPGKTMNCFWCSKQRRIELLKFANDNKFNKIALGHHLDDIAETLMMNIMFQGEISGMLPVVKYDIFNGWIIRPLASVREEYIIRYSRKMGFNSISCKCGMAGNSKRKEVREIIRTISANNPAIQENILRSMENVDMRFLISNKE